MPSLNAALSPAWKPELVTDLAAAAQRVYDAWDQVDGFDEDLGEGGICQDIASAMAQSMSEHGFEHGRSISASVGENHVFVVVLVPGDGVYSVDIPPHVYESGSGYVWRKKEGIVFSSDDVLIDRIGDDMPPDRFEEEYSE